MSFFLGNFGPLVVNDASLVVVWQGSECHGPIKGCHRHRNLRNVDDAPKEAAWLASLAALKIEYSIAP